MDSQHNPQYNQGTTVERLACELAFVYEGTYPTVITTLIVCILYWFEHSKSKYNQCSALDTDARVWYGLIALIIFTLIIGIGVSMTKKMLKTERPCKTLKMDSDCCPDNYDVPSGHTAHGVFHGLVLYSIGYRFLGTFLLLQAMFRYLGKQHSVEAVGVGGIYGLMSFMIFNSIFRLEPKSS